MIEFNYYFWVTCVWPEHFLSAPFSTCVCKCGTFNGRSADPSSKACLGVRVAMLPASCRRAHTPRHQPPPLTSFINVSPSSHLILAGRIFPVHSVSLRRSWLLVTSPGSPSPQSWAFHPSPTPETCVSKKELPGERAGWSAAGQGWVSRPPP